MKKLVFIIFLTFLIGKSHAQHSEDVHGHFDNLWDEKIINRIKPLIAVQILSIYSMDHKSYNEESNQYENEEKLSKLLGYDQLMINKLIH